MRKSEIEYFKNLLLERKTQILANLKSSSEEIAGIRESEATDEFDRASITTDSNLEQFISNKQRTELAEITRALNKIELGTYGICEMCEEEISVPRLKVKPHTKFCIACREIMEKSNKNKGIQ